MNNYDSLKSFLKNLISDKKCNSCKNHLKLREDIIGEGNIGTDFYSYLNIVTYCDNNDCKLNNIDIYLKYKLIFKKRYPNLKSK